MQELFRRYFLLYSLHQFHEILPLVQIFLEVCVFFFALFLCGGGVGVGDDDDDSDDDDDDDSDGDDVSDLVNGFRFWFSRFSRFSRFSCFLLSICFFILFSFAFLAIFACSIIFFLV